MLNKLVILIAILALVAAAGTVPTGGNYRITLMKPSMVNGTLLKAGEYKLSLGDAKVTIMPSNGKNPVEVPVKMETVEAKYSDTVIAFNNATGKPVISEIRLGGTKTKLIFD